MSRLLSFLLLFFSLRNISFSQQANAGQAYPRIIGYASVSHTIVTFDKNGSIFNFSGNYTVGFPFGINILKSEKLGFSFELTPIIKAENGTDKVSNFSFNPGIIFRLKHRFAFTTRMAFETSGRYGLTPVLSKILFTKNNINYFIAVPLPFRLGNDKPASLGVGLQLGISF